jgi:hypothetical protein
MMRLSILLLLAMTYNAVAQDGCEDGSCSPVVDVPTFVPKFPTMEPKFPMPTKFHCANPELHSQ